MEAKRLKRVLVGLDKKFTTQSKGCQKLWGAAEQAYEKWDKAANAHDDTIEKVLETAKEVVEELATVEKANLELTKGNARVEGALHRAIGKYENLVEQTATLRNNLAHAEHQREETAKRLKEAEEHFKNLQSSAGELQQDCIDLKNKNDALNADYGKLVTEHNEQTLVHQETLKRLNNATAILGTTKFDGLTPYREMVRELEVAVDAAAQLQTKNTELMQEIEQLKLAAADGVRSRG